MSGSTDLTSRQAVLAVEQAFNSLGWYSREPPAPDYGVDLYVEAAVDGVPNGRLLGVQVKGGESFFSEARDAHVVFRSGQRHLDYWLGHSLPVIVALHQPSTGVLLWQRVAEDTVQSTGEGWKLEVPRANQLDAASAAALTELADGGRYALALNALRADLGWMRLLEAGGAVWLEVEEWVNKSSGRGSIRLVGDPAGGGDRLERSRDVYFGLSSYELVLPQVLPWARLSVDEELYAEHETGQWELDEGFHDREAGQTVIVGSDFDEWRGLHGLIGLRPFAVEADELARWRLRVELGPLAEAALMVDRYLTDGVAE